MCGRYSLASPDPAQLRDRFPLGERVAIHRRFNVAPDDPVLTVTNSREGEPRGELLRWGLVPHWLDKPGSGAKMINARAETIAEKPAYRDAFRQRRCLIIADGFYEWEKREGRSKLPWHVTRADSQPFAFAGIWAIWHGNGEIDDRRDIRREPSGQPMEARRSLRTCSIVTTEANKTLHDIHPRMPVMLQPEEEAAWLSNDTPQSDLFELLHPLPVTATSKRPVSSAVNDAHNDTAQCLEDADPAELAPVTLF